MLFAPRYAPGNSQPNRLLRAFYGVCLSSFAALLLVANIVLYYANYYLVMPSVSPRELYHRAWVMTRDNFYDPSQLTAWEEWQHKFDDQIETEQDAVKYIRIMLDSLEDPHTFLLEPEDVAASTRNAEGQYVGIGITLGEQLEPNGNILPGTTGNGLPVVSRVFYGSPAEKAGLRSGDAIREIDGKNTANLNDYEAAALLKGLEGSSVKLTVERNGRDLHFTLSRVSVNIPVVVTQRLKGNTGYIRIDAFDQLDTAYELERALRELADCPALIIDLRDNPGGLIHEEVKATCLFLDHGLLQSLAYRIPGHDYLTYEIRLTETAVRFNLRYGSGLPALPVSSAFRPPNLSGDKPIVILVNEGTASAAEGFAVALQENLRAIVIGMKTFGKGVGQIYLPLGNGYRLRITNLYSYTPAGNWLGNGRIGRNNPGSGGITPDKVVPVRWRLNPSGLVDNQLQEAMALVEEQLKARKGP